MATTTGTFEGGRWIITIAVGCGLLLSVDTLAGEPPGGGNFALWQTFNGLRGGDAQWADIDHDYDLDLAISGKKSDGKFVTQIYENKSGILVLRQELIGVFNDDSSSNLAWGDYDGDGDVDLVLTGLTEPDFADRIARIYENDGEGNLTWDQQQVLTAVAHAAVAWGDYDGDGDSDLVVTGRDSDDEGISILYQNHPLGTLNPDSDVSLVGLSHGSADWIDYDNDGDPDLVLTGTEGDGVHRTIFYENDPQGTLKDTGSHGLPGMCQSDVAWGDYDNDGDLDLVMAGTTGPGQKTTRIYRNDGGGAFTLVASPQQVYRASCAWGDYDNDGDLDVAVCGYDSVNIHTDIYRNTGNGFTDAFSLEPVNSGSVAWADVDKDGDLDFFLMGTYYGWHEHAELYMNIGHPANTPPVLPTTTDQEWTADGLRLTWSGASDKETPVNGLYYCLRVGTSPGADDVVSGCYGTPLMGNVGQATEILLDIPVGEYFWAVRPIDTGLLGPDMCRGDLTQDRTVDMSDVYYVLAFWGETDTPADLNGDGVVNIEDIFEVLAGWGPCP